MPLSHYMDDGVFAVAFDREPNMTAVVGELASIVQEVAHHPASRVESACM